MEKIKIPDTRATAIAAEQDGKNLEAALFWGIVSAPRRSAHRLAWSDIEYAGKILKGVYPDFTIPDYIGNRMGLQAAEKFPEFVKEFLQKKGYTFD